MLQVVAYVVIALVADTLIGYAYSQKLRFRVGQPQSISIYRANDPTERRRWFLIGFNFGLCVGPDLARRDAVGGEALLIARKYAMCGAWLQLLLLAVIAMFITLR